MTRHYGLIGHPLVHSFSAKYFAEKFARLGIDATYENFDMPTVDGLRTFIAEHEDLYGLNVTIPHKTAVIPFLDALSPEAEEIGAVNVIKILRHDGIRLIGHNTDCLGFRDSLRAHAYIYNNVSPQACTIVSPSPTSANSEPITPPLRARAIDSSSFPSANFEPITPSLRALILGTGGASKAVACALRQLGITYQKVSRNPSAGITYDALTSELIADTDIIINCTPLGTFPNVETFPPIPYDALTNHHLLYDLVYNPSETRFLHEGRIRGGHTQNGLAMLHLQAEAAWRIFSS